MAKKSSDGTKNPNVPDAHPASQEPPVEPPVEPPKPPEPKKMKRWKPSRIPASFIEERTPFGTSAYPSKPTYVPPDLEVAWALHPDRDGGSDLNTKLAQFYEVVPFRAVTDDPDKAREEELIALPGPVYASGSNWSGGFVTKTGLVLLARRKEVGDAVRRRQRELFSRSYRPPKDLKHAEVVEDREEQRTIQLVREKE